MARDILFDVIQRSLTLPRYDEYAEGMVYPYPEHTIDASPKCRYLQVSFPEVCIKQTARRWGYTQSISSDELDRLSEIGEFLRNESHTPLVTYTGSNVEFHKYHSGFGFGKLEWLYRLAAHLGVRQHLSLDDAPELFMLMVKSGGLPTVEGNAAINFVRFLGENMTGWSLENRLLHNRNIRPTFANVEVQRQTVRTPRDGLQQYGPYQVTITVSPNYRRTLIGPKGANIRSIRAALEAMTNATVHIQVNAQ